MAKYDFCQLRVDFMDIDYHGNTEERTIDTALIHVRNSATRDINYTWQNAQCYKCPVFWTTLPSNTNCTQRLQTSFGNVIGIGELTPNSSLQPCKVSFLDTGEYTLDIRDDLTCNVIAVNDPPNPDLPVLYAFLVYFGLAIIWILLTKLHQRGVFNPCIQRITAIVNPDPTSVTTSRIEQKNSGDVATNQRNGLNECVINNSEETLVTQDISESDNQRNGEETAGTAGESNFATAAPADDAETGLALAADSKAEHVAAVRDQTAAAADSTTNITAAAVATPAVVKPEQPKTRLRSLDAFRGLSLTVMIFVNYGGAGYYYFEHAPWNGLLVADLVFPWFLWMMGTSMIFSFKGMLKRKTPRRLMAWKVVWRSIKLFAIGLCMGTKANNDMTRIRIPGILQRFGLVYLVTGLAYLPFANKVNMGDVRMLDDVIVFWPEWLIHFALLTVYLALTFALPVPGCPTGYLGPGGLAEGGAYRYCTGGAAGYADRVLFTQNHIFNYPTPKEIYYTTQAFDPEGFFTIIPTVFLCLLGAQAGKIVAMHKTRMQILVRWFIWVLLTGGLALLLCHGNENEGWIPLNKNLWSLSYIFAMTSTAFLLLIIMYLLIDVLDVWNGAPFIYPGMNSILIYVCHSVFSQYFPVSWDMPDPTSHWQLLVLCCWGTTFWLVVAYVLHRKHIYVAL